MKLKIANLFFQDASFAGDWNSTSTSRITHVCSHFVDVREAGAVSHSSTESERISLEAGLRTDGSLQFGKCVLLETLYCRSTKGNCERHGREGVIPTHSHFDTCVFESVDHLPPNIPNRGPTQPNFTFSKTMRQCFIWSTKDEAKI